MKFHSLGVLFLSLSKIPNVMTTADNKSHRLVLYKYSHGAAPGSEGCEERGGAPGVGAVRRKGGCEEKRGAVRRGAASGLGAVRRGAAPVWWG